MVRLGEIDFEKLEARTRERIESMQCVSQISVQIAMLSMRLAKEYRMSPALVVKIIGKIIEEGGAKP